MNVSDTESNLGIKQEYLQEKIENLKKAFEKQDKDLNGDIDKNELIDFLDSNCRSGKYDRNLANKIFSILDLDKNGRITINEFIKSYVGIIDDIKSQIRELEMNYKQEDINRARLELLVKNNLNEVLNDEDLGPNSKFIIEIMNIEYLKNLLNYDGILITIAFGNKRESTRILSTSTNDLVWQQKFELYFLFVFFNLVNIKK